MMEKEVWSAVLAFIYVVGSEVCCSHSPAMYTLPTPTVSFCLRTVSCTIVPEII